MQKQKKNICIAFKVSACACVVRYADASTGLFCFSALLAQCLCRDAALC